MASQPFGHGSFTELDRRPDQALAYGLVGRFWQWNYGLQPCPDGQAFLSFTDQPRLAMGFTVEPDGTPSTRLSTETRVCCPDPASLRQFRPYWLLIRPVSAGPHLRLLRRIAQIAEQPQ